MRVAKSNAELDLTRGFKSFLKLDVSVLFLLMAETETFVVLLSSTFKQLSDSSRRVRRAIDLVLDVFFRVMGVFLRWLRASVCVFESVNEVHVTVPSSTRFSCCVVPST